MGRGDSTIFLAGVPFFRGFCEWMGQFAANCKSRSTSSVPYSAPRISAVFRQKPDNSSP
jgi:hypothetical protein